MNENYFCQHYNENLHYILNNESDVGNNIVTFMDINEYDERERIKLYNKNVCQWTSGGVRKSFANLLRAYLEPETETLKQIFIEGQNFGVTRLEMTIYTNEIHNNIEYYENRMNDLENKICKAPIFYKTTIRNQWKAILEVINNNMVVLDRKSKTFYIIYYSNLLTDKFTSIVKKYNNKDINERELYCIRNFSVSCF